MANTNCLEGVQCPKCKQEHGFHITAKILVYVTDEGTEDLQGDYEWDKDSFCKCIECEHTGTVKDFTVALQDHQPAYPPRHDIVSLTEYDKYYDLMERANQIPLSYDKWKASNPN